MSIKGYLMVCQKTCNETNFDPEIVQKLSESNYFTKYWYFIREDALQSKKTSSGLEIYNRILFKKVQNIGVISNKPCFYFVI